VAILVYGGIIFLDACGHSGLYAKLGCGPRVRGWPVEALRCRPTPASISDDGNCKYRYTSRQVGLHESLQIVVMKIGLAGYRIATLAIGHSALWGVNAPSRDKGLIHSLTRNKNVRPWSDSLVKEKRLAVLGRAL
jgi:hypothetical protein